MNIPGFIDLQVNGYAGINFNDPQTTVDQVLEAAEILAGKGTAGFLATVVTRAPEAIEHNIETLTRAIKKQPAGGHILGIHLEGPFISPEYGYRGAHPPDWIRPPNLQWFEKLSKIAEGSLRLVTLAPECDNALEFIKAVSPQVVVAAGHSCCSFADIHEAVGAGCSMATHIGNGCRQNIDRHNNSIFNILACPQLTLTFIPDGFHLPEAFLRMLLACWPIEKLIAISDSAGLAGMEPGRYNRDGVDIIISESGRLYLASDPDMMAGSSSNMLECMNHLASLGVLTEPDLWRIGYANPLRILGVDVDQFSTRPSKVGYDAERKRFAVRH